MFSGRGARVLKAWLAGEAEAARSNEELAQRFVVECHRPQTILPAVSVIERLCADALVAAERRIDLRIVERLGGGIQDRLDALLTEDVEGRASRFVWLRQFEVGKNSADMNRLPDRLEFLQGLGLAATALDGVLPHRITRLRRQGERYFTDGLRDISSDRRLAILVVCTVEWQDATADAVIETHDRVVGKTWRDANALCAVQISDAKAALQDTLRSFSGLGAALLEAHGDDAPLDEAISGSCGWRDLEGLVATAMQLTNTMAANPLAHVAQGYHRFRRYAPRMLRGLDTDACRAEAIIVSGVVHQDRYRAKLISHLLQGYAQRGYVGQIAGQEQRRIFCAVCDGHRSRLGVAVKKSHLRSLPRQRRDNRAPDAGRTTGDKCNAPVKAAVADAVVKIGHDMPSGTDETVL